LFGFSTKTVRNTNSLKFPLR